MRKRTMPFVLPTTQVQPRKYFLPCKRCFHSFCSPPRLYRSMYGNRSLKLCRFYPVLLIERKQGATPGEFQDTKSFFKSLNESQNLLETSSPSNLDLSTPSPVGGGRKRRKPHSVQTKKKISQSLKGRSLSSETKKKISEAMKGKQFTPSHRIAISQRMQGPLNPMYGRRMSAQTRLKISLSLRKCKHEKGKKVDDPEKPVFNQENNTENPMQVDKTMLHEKYQQIRDSLHLEMDKEGLELIGESSWTYLDEGKKRKLKMIQKSVKKRLRQASRDMDGLELDEGFLVDDFIAKKLEPKVEKLSNSSSSSIVAPTENNTNSSSSATPLSSKSKPSKRNSSTCESCGGRGIKACEFCVKKYGVRSSKCIKCYGSGIMFCNVCNGSGELLSK
ncbi:hypothetical protein GpartN1_g2141.t1 [Galdieria partita]|uniref:Nuclease associated modular domain-containing protein n=1 Tax=Galdieria partita TaxID=83374 RepID=A0A9C7PTZ3_9RHOD|nr:hypothetical protein GpartN1_g2141.t1 [Galdieria partita]